MWHAEHLWSSVALGATIKKKHKLAFQQSACMFQHVGHTNFFKSLGLGFWKMNCCCLMCFWHLWICFSSYEELSPCVCFWFPSTAFRVLSAAFGNQIHIWATAFNSVLCLGTCSLSRPCCYYFQNACAQGHEVFFYFFHFSVLILCFDFFFQNFSSAGLTSAFWYWPFDTAFIAANCFWGSVYCVFFMVLWVVANPMLTS